MECDDYAEVIKRMFRGYFEALQRNDDPDDLRALVDLNEWVSRQLWLTAKRMNSGPDRWPLERIAKAVKMSKQAVYKNMKNLGDEQSVV